MEEDNDNQLQQQPQQLTDQLGRIVQDADNDDDDDDDIELVHSNCSYHNERPGSLSAVAATAPTPPEYGGGGFRTTVNHHHHKMTVTNDTNPFFHQPRRPTRRETTAAADGDAQEQDRGTTNKMPSPPFPMTFVEFVTVPPQSQRPPLLQSSAATTTSSMLTSPLSTTGTMAYHHHHHQQQDEAMQPTTTTTGMTTPPRSSWSPARGPFRLLPRGKATLDKVVGHHHHQAVERVAGVSAGAAGPIPSSALSAGGISSTLGGSPIRPRKRAAYCMMEAAGTATTLITAVTATMAAQADAAAAATSSPNSSTGLKQHLHRLSIHSPAGATANSSSVSREDDDDDDDDAMMGGGATCTFDSYFHRSSTPTSFAKTATTTPPTLDSPSSCFSKVVVTSTTLSASSPMHQYYHQPQRPQRRSNSTGGGGGGTPAPSPRIVPLTVLTHEDDGKLPSCLRSSHGRATTTTTATTTGSSGAPHCSRVFLPRSPPEVRSVLSIHDDGSNDDLDLSPLLPRTPNSGLSWMSSPQAGNSRQQRHALPKISLTPRSLAKRSPVIPRFPFADDNDHEGGGGEASHRFHAEPITVASFRQRHVQPTTRESLPSLPSPRVGASIFGPPTAREVTDSFPQLQEPPPQQQQQHERPDDMESLSDDDGEDDEFLLAFPSTLAEEKLQQQQRFRNVKARKSSEELFVLGDKTRSMTSMASSSCASLRGIAFAPSDPDLYAAHGSSTAEPLQYGVNEDPQNAQLQSSQQDGHIGWTFDADDHYVPARDLVTPPIPTSSTTTTSSSSTMFPPPLPPSSQRLAAASATATAASTTTGHPGIESPLLSMSTE